MIKVDTCHKAWALKYDLGKTKHTCYNCGIEVELVNPVITKDWVGLESEPHEPCGQRFKISILKPRDKETRKLLEG